MRFADEHEHEHLVADFGVISVERYAAQCLSGEPLTRRMRRTAAG
jgi:hypothetical protein